MKRLHSALLRIAGAVTLAAAVLGASPTPARAEKLRDLVEVSGARENQLVGFGVVMGLAGTGDDSSAPVAAKATIEMLRRLGVAIDAEQVKLKNVAAVVVTATLPPFAKPGTKIDVNVASLGNAKSLAGGTLIQGLLKGADQKTYAVAQGALIVGGFSAKGSSGSSVKQGSTTSGRVPGGAIVEREIPSSVVDEAGQITLSLRSPSFSLASRLVKAIDTELGEGTASAPDSGSVVIKVPDQYKDKTVELIAKLEEIEVAVVRKARIVISEKDGTIVAGGDVRLAPVAIVHGSLTIVVKEAPKASQPVVGKATTVPSSDVTTHESGAPMQFIAGAASLADVASALGALGLSARELASVLNAIKTAGALEAEIVVE
ncbi:MAG: flagellar basal body P-ring protein FlgI [Polyangiaceae bacterium]